MVTLNVKIEGMDALQARLKGMQKQVTFAAARALTKTAQLAKDAAVKEMRDVFDRPTPYTLNSLYVRSATPGNLTAVVWLKDDTSKGTAAAKYLLPQIKGGSRNLKRFEKALISSGAMPSGYRAVPGSGAKVDAYGNMDRGQIVQILSFFKAFPEVGYKANMSDKRRASLARGTKSKQGYAYFVGRPGDRLPLGIWQRFHFAKGSAIKPVVLFVTHARYQAIYDFGYVVERTVEREWPRQFNQSLADALATAR